MTRYRVEVGPVIVRDDEYGDAVIVAWLRDSDRALAKRIAWLLTHACPTCMGPRRKTVGMVCQTCGTDYGSDS